MKALLLLQVQSWSSNPFVGSALAIGLFDAGLLGAICISLASSWAMGEVFGWAHSINNKPSDAPMFYVFYFLSLIGAGIVVLLPGAPLVLITLFRTGDSCYPSSSSSGVSNTSAKQ